MSFLDDFGKQHVDIKAFILGTILVGPFWYISIYLFHRTFFFASPIFLPIIFSYCLTLCSVAIGLLIFSAPLAFTGKQNGVHTYTPLMMYMYGISSIIIIISFWIVIGKMYNNNFYKFIERVFYTEFVFLIIALICVVIISVRKVRKVRNKPKT